MPRQHGQVSPEPHRSNLITARGREGGGAALQIEPPAAQKGVTMLKFATSHGALAPGNISSQCIWKTTNGAREAGSAPPAPFRPACATCRPVSRRREDGLRSLQIRGDPKCKKPAPSVCGRAVLPTRDAVLVRSASVHAMPKCPGHSTQKRPPSRGERALRTAARLGEPEILHSKTAL